MALSPDWVEQTSTELRTLGNTLRRISRTLHEHVRKLEVAVEGKYANDLSDARVRLLSDSLHVSRIADLELGRLDQAMQRMVKTLQQSAERTIFPFDTLELERNALATDVTQIKEQRDELGTLYEIARVLNSTLEFDEVLRLVMDRVIEFVDAERGFLMLTHPDTGEPVFTIARNKEAHTVPESEFGSAHISRSTVKRVIATRVPELADDAQMDNVFKSRDSIRAYGIRSIMCAPLVVRNTCIGAVYVDSRVNAHLFGPKHRDLLLAFCNQAAIAIDNARLFADLNKALEQVSEDKQYMENIFGSIANGVITTDSSGRITTLNASASIILHISAEWSIGQHYQEVFQPLPQAKVIELLRDAYLQHNHGTIVNRAVDCEIPGRGWVNLNFYVTALRDMQEKHIGMALVIDDHTELQRSKAQAKQLRRIFEHYVHPNVVQQLIQDPRTLKLGGETKEISVLFADIRGYTSLSERLAPEEVMNLINRYLNIMCEAIWEEEGTLTAFQGDALMAIFNAPLPQKMHALQAVRAAWKMRMAVLEYQRAQPQEVPISFGFGVNTGLATVGNVGSQERMQNYTAIGDVVNVASRLQSNVSDNSILLNETTYQHVYHAVQTGQPLQLQVKNKFAPLTVRYVLGVQ